MPAIEFGSLDAADSARQMLIQRGHLSPRDDARSSTVVVEDDAPDQVLSRVQGMAADSRAHEAEQHGQVELTDRERSRVDFSREGVNVPKLRSIKAVAASEGVNDWMSFADFTLSVDENREVLKSASTEERGRRGGRDRESEEMVAVRNARGYREQEKHEEERAKDFAFEGDEDAQEFVLEGGSLGDVLDINFRLTESGPVGSGQDYERLLDKHEERPQRAQTADEHRTAPPTRDPFEWLNNPGRFDYPGIDTVDPEELHEERSERSREADESDLAPVTDDMQLWALNMDRYDYEGIDTPDPEKMHERRSDRARDLDEQQLAETTDDPIKWARNPGRYDYVGVDDPQADEVAEVAGDNAADDVDDDIQFIYEETDDLGMSLEEFEERTNETIDDMAGLADEFAAASMVAQEEQEPRR